MQKTWFEIYREEAIKYGLRVEDIEKVFSSQFHFIRKVYSETNTKEEELPTILLPELGRFFGKKNKTKKYQEDIKRMNEINDNTTDINTTE